MAETFAITIQILIKKITYQNRTCFILKPNNGTSERTQTPDFCFGDRRDITSPH